MKQLEAQALRSVWNGIDPNAPLEGFAYKPVAFSWPVHVSAKLNDLKKTARLIGFETEASRYAISSALVAREHRSGDTFSRDLRAWRRGIWFADPPLTYRVNGLKLPMPVVTKLDAIAAQVDIAGDKTDRTELTSFIVDETELTTGSLRNLLQWYKQASVRDVMNGYPIIA